jgi:hypothetical protein
VLFRITERVYFDVWVGSRAVKWSDQAPRIICSGLGDVPLENVSQQGGRWGKLGRSEFNSNCMVSNMFGL